MLVTHILYRGNLTVLMEYQVQVDLQELVVRQEPLVQVGLQELQVLVDLQE